MSVSKSDSDNDNYKNDQRNSRGTLRQKETKNALKTSKNSIEHHATVFRPTPAHLQAKACSNPEEENNNLVIVKF